MRRLLPAATAALMLLAACSGSPQRPRAVVTPSTVGAATTETSTSIAVTTTRPATTTVAPTTVPPTTTPTTQLRPAPTAPPATNPPVTASTSPPPPAGPSEAQMIVVSASSYGQTYATLDAYDRTSAGWVLRFGPWTARIGRNGFAPTGAKHEGDGRTPSGTYGFSFFFGIEANPGVLFPYRPITSSSIVWDDDPASANYNEWIDTRVAAAGVGPEPMDNAPVYDYGAVIAYNTTRTPGLGSAIFFHVSDGQSTAGCVALPVSQLLEVLRWMNPHLSPLIRMGVDAGTPT